MPENDPGRDLRARSVELISYPLDFLMRRQSIVIFPWRSSPSACSMGGGGRLDAGHPPDRRSPGRLILFEVAESPHYRA
jgi:hypothetical protein